MVLMTPGKKPSTRVRGEGHPRRVGPWEPPATSVAGSWGRHGPSRTPALLPGRGTKLISIQSSPVTNVMIVNKPPAGHQGTTQAQTRCGGRARAHPESGRRIRSPKCVLVGGDYERAAKFITLSCPPRVWRWRGHEGPKWGVPPFPAPRAEGGIGPGSSPAPVPCSVSSSDPLPGGRSEPN